MYIIIVVCFIKTKHKTTFVATHLNVLSLNYFLKKNIFKVYKNKCLFEYLSLRNIIVIVFCKRLKNIFNYSIIFFCK